MSLLIGSHDTFRGVCHNHLEADGGAAAEGLADDTGTDRASDVVKDIAVVLGVYRRMASRALRRGGTPPGRRPAARMSKLEPYMLTVDRLLEEGVWHARVILREIQTAGYQSRASMLRVYIAPKLPL